MDNKEEIKKNELELQKQAVEHLVDKRVKQLLPDELSMDKMVDQAIKDRSLYWYSKEQHFDDRVVDKVAKILAKKIVLKVEAKK